MDEFSYHRLREVAKDLADAAETVDNNIMNNGLAFHRERLRWFIDQVRWTIEKEDERGRADVTSSETI